MFVVTAAKGGRMSDTNQLPLGELLVRHGVMGGEALAAALEEQRTSGRPLGEIIVERGYAPAPLVAQALATQQGGLTKTEYGYATGWADAVDERDREIAELRAWVTTAQAEIATAERRRVGYGKVVAKLQERVRALEATLEEAHAEPWATAGSHLLFVRNAAGYELVERDGPPPAAGELVEGCTVARVAALGGVPCAYLLD
jgi:hypothetical protein